MKRYLLTLSLLFAAKLLSAQFATISPDFPTINDEITLTFDVTQATDDRATGLIGLTDDVYLWSGAGDETNAFKFGPPGQNDFFQPYEPGTMTFLGDDKWEIKFTPKDYFQIPDGNEITRLGLLLKSGNGSSQTEDFFIDLDPGKFINFTAPASVDVINFVSLNEMVTIAAEPSEAGDLEMFIDEGEGFVSVASATGASTVSYIYTITKSTTISVKIVATISGETVERVQDIEFFLAQDTMEEALPAGLTQGINYDQADHAKATLVLLAPLKERCYVVGEFTNWELKDDFQMKRDPDGETFWFELTGLTAGEQYIFQYWVDGVIKVGDPYADKVADPWNDEFIPEAVYPGLKEFNRTDLQIATVIETGQTPYEWDTSEDSWVRPDKQDLVVYELLVRDFIGSHDYKDLIDTLSYLKKLGVNAIEFMPIMEFEGNNSWGYNPMYFFAPDKYYGTKDDLKSFIETAHQEGFAVILDMVLNHAFGLNSMVKMYWDSEANKPSTESPWFNPDATHPFNVGFDFNHESQYTKDFVDDVNNYWIEEYHFDGYRFDLSKGFTQTNNPDDVGAWGALDQSRINILVRMADKIWETDADAYVILEHFADGSEENILKDEGMMVWGNNNGDFREVLAGNSTSRSFESATDLSRVSYMESHDEERIIYETDNHGKVEGDYDIMDLETGLNRSKLGAAFFFTLSGPKLIWQFQELGYDIDIDFNGRTGEKPQVWGTDGLGYYDDELRLNTYKAYAAIINLTHELRTIFDEGTRTNLLTGRLRTITVEHADGDVKILGNFDTRKASIAPSFTQTGTWYDYFTGEALEVTNRNESIELEPGEFHILTTVQVTTPEADLVPFMLPEVEIPTGIEDELEGLSVFPNPASSAFNVISDEEVKPVVLRDISGRQVELSVNYISTREFSLDLSGLNDGIYLLELAKGGEVRRVKFIVSN